MAVYLNQSPIAGKKLDPAEVDRTAARAAYGDAPYRARLYARRDRPRRTASDDIGGLITNGFNVRRGADIEVVVDPYWIVSDKPASHTSPYGYDVHVPLIFLGPDIRAGLYDSSIAVNDVAPTLAAILDVETPSGSAGRVLSEIFAQ